MTQQFTDRQKQLLEKIDKMGINPMEKDQIKKDLITLSPEEFERRHNKLAIALGLKKTGNGQ